MLLITFVGPACVSPPPSPLATTMVTPALRPPGIVELAAGRRVALVIGNSNYRHQGGLANPANDARAVAATLRQIGFAVSEGIDLNRRDMDDALVAFARAAETADDALVFYAGHGIQAYRKYPDARCGRLPRTGPSDGASAGRL